MSKVPRRESPWGMPEGDNREPKAHRCNDRVEDVIQACFEGNPFKTVPGPFKLFWQCMRSKPGEEPTEPYTYLQIDPPRREASNFWLSHHMRELRQTFRTWSGGIGILAFCFALMIWFIEYKW